MKQLCSFDKFYSRNTSLAAQGALACKATSPSESKMAARGPHNGRRGLERCPPSNFCQLLQNKFFDLSTYSLKKGCDGEKKCGGGEWKYKLC